MWFHMVSVLRALGEERENPASWWTVWTVLLAACPEVLEEGRGRARCTVVSPQMHGQSCRGHVADDSHWLSPSHSYCRETGSLLTFTHRPQRGRMKPPVWGSTFVSVCVYSVCVWISFNLEHITSLIWGNEETPLEDYFELELKYDMKSA